MLEHLLGYIKELVDKFKARLRVQRKIKNGLGGLGGLGEEELMMRKG
jgi:hypothetical protein